MKKFLISAILMFLIFVIISCGNKTPVSPAVNTPVPEATGTWTPEASVTATFSMTATATMTGDTATVTATATKSGTQTESATQTNTPTQTLTFTDTSTCTFTPTSTTTFTATPTVTLTMFYINVSTEYLSLGIKNTLDAGGLPAAPVRYAYFNSFGMSGYASNLTVTVDNMDDALPGTKLPVVVTAALDIFGIPIGSPINSYQASSEGCESCLIDFGPGSNIMVSIYSGMTLTAYGIIPALTRASDGYSLSMTDSGFLYTVTDLYYPSTTNGTTPAVHYISLTRPSTDKNIQAAVKNFVPASFVETVVYNNSWIYALPTSTPTVTPTATATSTAVTVSLLPSNDTTLSEANPTINYGTCVNITVSSPGTAGSANRAVLKFDLSSIPAGSTVYSAQLYYKQDLTAGGITGAGTVLALRLTSVFTEGAECANAGAPNWTVPWSVPGGSYNAASPATCAFIATSTGVSFTLDPAWVETWIDTPALNFGLLFALQNEDTTTATLPLCSSEAAVLNRPSLTIVYR